MLKVQRSDGSSLGREQKAECLFFTWHQQSYAISVFDIREVLSSMDVLQDPKGDQPGVCCLREQSLPLWDISDASLLSKSDSFTGLKSDQSDLLNEPGAKKMGIVIDYQRQSQVIWVDSIQGVRAIEWHDLKEAFRVREKGQCLGAFEDQGESHLWLHWDILWWSNTHDKETMLEQLEKLEASSASDSCVMSIGERQADTDLALRSVDSSSLNPQEPAFQVLIIEPCPWARAEWNAASLGLKKIHYQKDALVAVTLLEQLKKENKLGSLEAVAIHVDLDDKDGYQLSHYIKSDPSLSHLKVCLYHALGLEANKPMAEAVGADYDLPIFNQKHIQEMLAWL